MLIPVNPLRTVSSGLGLVLGGSIMALLALVVGTVGTGTLFILHKTGTPDRLISPLALAGSMGAIAIPLACYLLVTLGTFLCLTAPPEARCGEVLVVALLLEMIVLILHVQASLPPALAFSSNWQQRLAWAQMAAIVSERLLFVAFLARLANYLELPKVARQAWSAPCLLALASLLAGVAAVIVVWWQAWERPKLQSMPPLAIALGLALTFVTCGLVVVSLWRYLRVLAQLRTTIESGV